MRIGRWSIARNPARDLVRRADAARESRDYVRAALLYEEALRHRPERADLHVQRGHMLKEAGDLAGAEAAYALAEAVMPRDADLAMQQGHLFKAQGRIAEAHAAYGRARALAPEWSEPVREIASLAQAGFRAAQDEMLLVALPDGAAPTREDLTIAESDALRIAAPLAPGRPVDALHGHGEEIAVRGLGRRERTPWGVLHTLRGVSALRGFCIAATPVVQIELMINGALVHRGGLKGGYVLPNERDNPEIRKYTFNVWIDLTGFATGRYEVHYRATKLDGTTLERRETVMIAPPFAPSPLPDSDNDVPPPESSDTRPLDEQINGRPSMIREAKRSLLSQSPRTILVQRADVLGDLVVAVPALRRLRGLFPDATIVGVLSSGNVDFARTLGLFDEIVVTELNFNAWERRRVVTAEAQRKLADDLSPWQFDMAIDLSTSAESRLLLPLSGAPVLVGFSAGEFPNLTVEVAGAARDRYNGHENVPHTNQAVGLIEWLAVQMRDEPNLLRRDDLPRSHLAAFGLADDARYVVLHAGGRWPFTRWPHFLALAERLLERTDLDIVLLTTDSDAERTLPATLAGDPRFRISNRRVAFDELDALVSYCSLFVGDDSGVKHLAGLRGVEVIGIQNARNNWCEWGQSQSGFSITRKVPCAGCLIQNYPESDDCGRDFVCITAITPDEVLGASLRLLERAGHTA
jgi:ADP-heptose:LPS heptosyltransferase